MFMADVRKDDMALSLVHRLSHFVMWVALLSFHSALLCIFLLLAWAYSIEARAVVALIHKAALFLRIEETWQMLAFWGVSGSTILFVYVWLWRKIYWSFVTPYLFANVKYLPKREAS